MKLATTTRKKPLSIYHQLVRQLVESDNIIWPKEIKLAKNLLKKYPDMNFWLTFNKKFPSLACFLTQNAEDFVKQKYLIFKLDIAPKKQYNLENHKIGEDIAFENRPRTIADFLRKKYE